MLDQNKNRGVPTPYLANVNVRWGEFILDDLRVMRFEEHERDRYGLKYGDIVMCEGGGAWTLCHMERTRARNDDPEGSP